MRERQGVSGVRLLVWRPHPLSGSSSARPAPTAAQVNRFTTARQWPAMTITMSPEDRFMLDLQGCEITPSPHPRPASTTPHATTLTLSGVASLDLLVEGALDPEELLQPALVVGIAGEDDHH